MFVNDFVMNGEGHGPVGEMLAECRYEPGLLKPYFETNPNSPHRGRPCVTINTGRMVYNNAKGVWVPQRKQFLIADLQRRGINSPVFNAVSLRKEQWIQIEQAVVPQARLRMRMWGDVAAQNPYGGFDGMATMTLEYEASSDPGEAVVDMDAISDARTDSPLFKLRSMPLPITHSDFWFSERRLAVSGNRGQRLDTTMAEAGGRRVGESVEKVTIGVDTGVTYGTQTAGYGTHEGTSTVYGATNLPTRMTKTNLTIPTGANPEATVADILSMRQTMYNNKFFGPFMIYHSTDWDLYLDNDYARLGGNNASMTLRDRLRSIEDIQDIRRLDFLNNTFTLLMIQMTSDVVRAVIGMDLKTVQWPSQGGMRQNFKIMCIKVPQFRWDYNGIAAVLHATTA